jgi:hypothetical protein
MHRNEQLVHLKTRAMERPRRVIFDNDGGDVAQLCPGTTDRELIATRVGPALEAGVDTYVYTTGWGFGIGLHDSRVGSVLRTKRGHLSRSLVDEFVRDDTDCLRIEAEFVRQSGREFFWGMRMNDTHDAGYDNVFMEENEFKRHHPDVMFGPGIAHGAVTAVDYLDERVRQFAISYIVDVVDRYPIDGIFLDFFRHPIFFRSNAAGLPATTGERDAMSSFMERLSGELDRRRLDRGKYYLVAIRVPDSVEYCNAIGIDIERWLESGWADLLFTTSYLRFNEWDYSAGLGHRFGVPVYPSLDESRVRSELPKHARNCLHGYLGRVMQVWDSACDGVFMFNNSGLRDISRNIEQNWFAEDAGTNRDGLEATVKGRDHVASLPKRYFASVLGVGAVAGGALPHESYIDIPTLNHHAPLRIDAGRSIEVPVRIGDDFGTGTARSTQPAATANIFVFGEPDSIVVSIDGKRLALRTEINTRADLDPARREYRLIAGLPPGSLSRGVNTFRFESREDTTLLDLWVDVEGA